MVVAPGETEIDDPVPTKVPTQLPEYQFQEAPRPSTPPLTLNVVEAPAHIGLGVADAPIGAVDDVFIVTGKQVGTLVPHKLLAVTQILPALPGVAVIDVVF